MPKSLIISLAVIGSVVVWVVGLAVWSHPKAIGLEAMKTLTLYWPVFWIWVCACGLAAWRFS